MSTIPAIINQWADDTRPTTSVGHSGSVRFRGTKLYSYDCQIAQIYPRLNLCLVRDPNVSVTTAKHCSLAYRSGHRYKYRTVRLRPDVAREPEDFAQSASQILLDEYHRTRRSRNELRGVKGKKHAALFETLTAHLRELEHILYELGAVLPDDAETPQPLPEPKRLRALFIGE